MHNIYAHVISDEFKWCIYERVGVSAFIIVDARTPEKMNKILHISRESVNDAIVVARSKRNCILDTISLTDGIK